MPPPTPTRVPMTVVRNSIPTAALNVESAEATIKCSNTRTASTAPMGSMTMPSHLSVLETRRLGRTCRSNGPITVGPVTTRIAPSRKQSCQSKAEREIRRGARSGEGDHRADRAQTERRAARFSQLVQLQRQTALEQDNGDGERNEGKQNPGPRRGVTAGQLDQQRVDLNESPQHDAEQQQQQNTRQVGPPGDPLCRQAERGNDREIKQKVHIGAMSPWASCPCNVCAAGWEKSVVAAACPFCSVSSWACHLVPASGDRRAARAPEVRMAVDRASRDMNRRTARLGTVRNQLPCFTLPLGGRAVYKSSLGNEFLHSPSGRVGRGSGRRGFSVHCRMLSVSRRNAPLLAEARLSRRESELT